MKSPTLLMALLIAGAGTTAFVHNHGATAATTLQGTNAAYRDGHYLGKLAAQRGDNPHIASGRWGTMEDRNSFSDGYRQAYREVSAARSNHLATREALLERP